MVVGEPVEPIEYRLSNRGFLRPFLSPLFFDRRLGRACRGFEHSWTGRANRPRSKTRTTDKAKDLLWTLALAGHWTASSTRGRTDGNMEASEAVGVDQFWIYTGEAEVPDSVTHVRVSDDVTVLRARTFSRRERLVSVELNEGLVHVGGEAFYFCSSLEYVRFPSSVKTVGVKAFSECRKLNHVEFPEDSRGAMAIGRELLLIAGH